MTSKKSFSLNIGQTPAGFSNSVYAKKPAVFVLSLLVYILYYPLLFLIAHHSAMIQLESYHQDPNWNSNWTTADIGGKVDLVTGYVSNIGGLRTFSFLPVLFVVFLIGFSGFSYMFHANTVDFYESQPEKRIYRFLRIIRDGSLIFLLASGIGLLLGCILMAAMGGMSGALWLELWLSFVQNFVLFLALFAFVSLACCLAGNLIISMGLCAFLLSISAIVVVLFDLACDAFLTTYSDSSGMEDYIVFSPIANLVRMYIGGTSDHAVYGNALVLDTFAAGGEFLWRNLLLAVLAWGLAYTAYHFRAMEKAGKALVYSWFEITLKVVCVVIGGFAMGFLFEEVIDGEGGIGAYLMILVFGLIIACIAESVYAADVRKMFRRPLVTVLSCLAAVLIYAGMKYDVLGYDRYIPPVSKVESIAIYNYQDDPSYLDENLDRISMPRYYTTFMKLPYTEEAREMIKEGLTLNSPERREAPDEGAGHLETIYVHFRMKSGRTQTRNFEIDLNGSTGQKLAALVETKEYKETYFGVTDACIANVKKIYSKYPKTACLSLNTDLTHTESRDKGLVDEFFKAYKKDLEQYNLELAKTELPYATVQISNQSPDSEADFVWTSVSYPVYREYTNCLALFQKHKMTPDLSKLAKDTESISIGTINIEKNHEVRYTKPKEIRAILESVLCASLSHIGTPWYGYGMQHETTVTTLVKFKAGASSGEETVETNEIPEHMLPEFVRKDLIKSE